MKVFYHKIGTKQDQDVILHQDKKNPDYKFHMSSTVDDKYYTLTTNNNK